MADLSRLREADALTIDRTRPSQALFDDAHHRLDDAHHRLDAAHGLMASLSELEPDNEGAIPPIALAVRLLLGDASDLLIAAREGGHHE
ncbi:hypothetical protein [Larsenimonas rhizosphaerae]|uniref:hypothetical protein n=1 Tax=Larsenimonas rhizosphaerae TaxID=2944682 RepID=UPI00203372B2|nr:hypothetical protein [Larsenimonas rhizosphaerae]MCM2131966.1 hypothetical protein [Larsenimonas rhizosphaerae]